MTVWHGPTARRVAWTRVAGGLSALAMLTVSSAAPAMAQPAARRRAEPVPGPWFSVPLPPDRGAVPAVVVGDRGTRPAIVPAGEAGYRELDGRAIRADVETVIAFATESRTTRGIGSGQLWGRITGFPSSIKTVNWAAEQFRKAGIKDVRAAIDDAGPSGEDVAADAVGVQAAR